ncbi:hypothetical protein DCS32_06240 [Dokdonia sp. Dokd-P16]|uniref:hypothetical protein n=1 Tax=Dokdonia sp. Dokd-P16 TaxID=2173169 RepID=UPI000D546887|nr:hypothetical protein [Dokdonia sp. Dokd-P16]AWH73768.1 hypothetical protein DCS32_06240 [Dokdonia sp. Dokd-P16]
MRSTTFYLLLLSLLAFGCSTNDDNQATDNNEITEDNQVPEDNQVSFDLTTENFSGIYDITLIKLEQTSSYTSNGETVEEYYTSIGSNFETTWTFAENATFTLTGSYTLTDTREENGVQIFTDTYDLLLDESGSFVVDSDNATVRIIFSGNDNDEDDARNLFFVTSFSETTISLLNTRSETDSSLELRNEIELTRR